MAAQAAAGATLSGGCLCGAVRFTARPKSREYGACHCSICRKWSTGPFLAVDCDDTVKFEKPESVGVYRSSEWAERGFCKTCGTSLFYRLVEQPFCMVSVGAFDEAASFTFTSQIFIDEKPSSYDFANATKNMTGAEVLAAFAPPPTQS